MLLYYVRQIYYINTSGDAIAKIGDVENHILKG